MYEIFEHTADVGLRVRAAELDELFADAARGLISLLVANPDAVQPVQQRTVRIDGDEYDYLLFDWLSELLYPFETQRLLLSRFEIHVQHDGLSATCWGETMDPQRHQMDHEVKAVTYHELKVLRDGQGWLAEVILDI